jgi:hypothetical protein
MQLLFIKWCKGQGMQAYDRCHSCRALVLKCAALVTYWPSLFPAFLSNYLEDTVNVLHLRISSVNDRSMYA